MQDKGTYCLLLSNKDDLEIEVGKLGLKRFKPGYYLYIGSALKNMEKRIGRHLKKKKKKFWHLDYLTTGTSFQIEKIYSINKKERLECTRARELERILDPVAGFGSTDCRCGSHLFFAGSKRRVNHMERYFIIKSGFEEYNYKTII